MAIKLGILYERIRKDEKLLIEKANGSGLDVIPINDRELIFALEKKRYDMDIILERCINHSRAMYSLQIFNAKGIRTINSAEAAEISGSKFLVTSELIKNNVPTPQASIAFSKESALAAVEKMGYPCVFKPAIGTWGVLLAKVNDREAAEAVVDHKQILGSYHHSVYYIQKYVPKPNRDIKVFVIGDRAFGAVYREGTHWITHPNKGATIKPCPISEELEKISLAATEAVGGEIVAVDVVESDEGLQVLEVDYTVEFSQFFPHLSEKIVDEIIDYTVEKVRKA
jgi:[lysine-biosynthesis-protein LysW]--L-2-aminoadipate ligase